uniref:Uncharacterized protein n=1 Tax=Piliocolobus tephrosceles TaxID=591936 RepID=A0A8C9HK65_9PRIM
PHPTHFFSFYSQPPPIHDSITSHQAPPPIFGNTISHDLFQIILFCLWPSKSHVTLTLQNTMMPSLRSPKVLTHSSIYSDVRSPKSHLRQGCSPFCP